MTLVEVIVAIAIMGIAFTAVLGAMGTLTSTSGLVQRRADVAAVVRNAAEIVAAESYVACTPFESATPYAVSTASTFDTAPPNVVEVAALGGSPVYMRSDSAANDTTNALAGTATSPTLFTSSSPLVLAGATITDSQAAIPPGTIVSSVNTSTNTAVLSNAPTATVSGDTFRLFKPCTSDTNFQLVEIADTSNDRQVTISDWIVKSLGVAN